MPFRATWSPEMTRECFNLGTERQCWIVIDRKEVPEAATLIDSVWDFKCKFRNGVFEKVRARICAKSFQQKKGIDSFASPTASQVSIRLVYAFAALSGWWTMDLNASAVFISGRLSPNKYVFMNSCTRLSLSQTHWAFIWSCTSPTCIWSPSQGSIHPEMSC